jgi:3-oxoacyl-[acyl-carrier protein] reductase
MLLRNKNAIIYGGGGAIGGAVARAFALAGAKVFLAGRTQEKLEKTVWEISAAGGVAHAEQVDALNKKEIEKLIGKITDMAGTIDISFNAIGLDDMHGLPLTEMEYESFGLPIMTAMKTHFLTGTAALQHMALNGSGVIMAITANAGHTPYPNVGGFGVACAAIEGFCRQLAAEAGPQGVRVICLRSAGSPDAPGVDNVFHLHARNAGISRDEFESRIAERTLLKRLPRLSEIANAAVLMASDRASAITAAVTNLTCGEIAD